MISSNLIPNNGYVLAQCSWAATSLSASTWYKLSGCTAHNFPSSKKESYTTFLGTSNPVPLNTTPDDTTTTEIPSKHKDHQPEDVETNDAEGSDDNNKNEGDNMVDTMSNVNP